MKPERHQPELDRAEWRIGLQAWEVRMPSWVPEVVFLGSPAAMLAVAALLALAAAITAVASLAMPVLCAVSALLLFGSAVLLGAGVLPRYAVVRGPELVLGIGPSHLHIAADWPYVPADRLTGALAGLGWAEAGGRRIAWADLLGARLSDDRRHLELMQTNRTVLRLPVAGSRRWDRTLADVARELDDHCRRVHSGAAPPELDALRKH